MGYLACPQCGSSNRDTDSNCFSCNADLTAIPPPPPPPVPEPAPQEAAPELDVRVTRIGSDKVDQPRFKDLASRYEAKPLPKWDATVLHGLRSGLVGGILVGIAMAIFRVEVIDDVTRLLVRFHYVTDPKKLFDIALLTFLGDIFFGLVMGAILGLTNLLCWGPESGRTGAVIGLLVGCAVFYLKSTSGSAEYLDLLIGAVHGWLMGFTISLVERKLFRGI